MKFLVLFILMIFQLPTSDNARQTARRAHAYGKDQIHGDAEVANKRALKEKFDLYEARFNLGNVLYKQERYKEALNQYRDLANDTSLGGRLKAKAYYNAGTTLLKMNNMKESKSAFIECLRLDPGNNLAKYNLAYAIMKLKDEEQSKGDGKSESNSLDNKQGNDQKDIDRNHKDLPGALEQHNTENILQLLDMQERSLQERIKRNYNSKTRQYTEKDW